MADGGGADGGRNISFCHCGRISPPSRSSQLKSLTAFTKPTNCDVTWGETGSDGQSTDQFDISGESVEPVMRNSVANAWTLKHMFMSHPENGAFSIVRFSGGFWAV